VDGYREEIDAFDAPVKLSHRIEAACHSHKKKQRVAVTEMELWDVLWSIRSTMS
jgi:hypothetical protein